MAAPAPASRQAGSATSCADRSPGAARPVGHSWFVGRHGRTGTDRHRSPALPPEQPRRGRGVARRSLRVRRAPTADTDRHQPARPGQASDRDRARLPRRQCRAAGAADPSVERGRLGVGGRRHVGDGRREPGALLGLVPHGLGALRHLASPRSRSTHRRGLRGGTRAAATPRSATCWCGWSPRPRSTPATATSCARRSTVTQAATPTTCLPTSGRRTSARIQAAADTFR